MSNADNGWQGDQKLVLSELKRLDRNIEKLTDRIDTSIKHERANRVQVEQLFAADLQALTIEVHGLKIKAGVWGLLGGLLPVMAALILKQI